MNKEQNKTLVIAEIGANFNQNFDQAKALIDVAVESGSDVCKFQTYTSHKIFAKQTKVINGIADVRGLFKSIEIDRDWQKDLKAYSDEKGIEFMSTPFDEDAIQELVDIGVKRMKISGFESTDPRFVEAVASTGLPIIMSAGIGFNSVPWGPFAEIFEKYGNHLTLLHCNNAYPTPMEDICLPSMDSLKELLHVDEIGLSDHTMSPLTPALAVARGATCIEKHITLSQRLPGPDHPFAMEPHQLNEMVKLIRLAEKTQNTQSDIYTKSEKGFISGRRSIVSKVDLKPGDILTKDMITTKRPYFEESAPAIDYFNVVGSKINSYIEADNVINKSDIKDYYESKPYTGY